MIPRVQRLLLSAVLGLAFLSLTGCMKDTDHVMVVSSADQRLMLLKKGQPVATYPVSTSKFGLGDSPNSYRTPLGRMEVAEKIGDGAPIGAVFKSRQPTGEVIRIDAPGRDPIVTRILWLKGAESQNANAYQRTIYIHGTPEERNIGRPVSFGCVRMRSADVVQLFSTVGFGADVYVSPRPLNEAVKEATGVTVPPVAPPPAASVTVPALAVR